MGINLRLYCIVISDEEHILQISTIADNCERVTLASSMLTSNMVFAPTNKAFTECGMIDINGQHDCSVRVKHRKNMLDLFATDRS